MGKYRAKFLTHGERVYDVSDFEAKNDEAAIAYAVNVLSAKIGKGHEIWQGDRLVHKEEY